MLQNKLRVFGRNQIKRKNHPKNQKRSSMNSWIFFVMIGAATIAAIEKIVFPALPIFRRLSACPEINPKTVFTLLATGVLWTRALSSTLLKSLLIEEYIKPSLALLSAADILCFNAFFASLKSAKLLIFLVFILFVIV